MRLHGTKITQTGLKAECLLDRTDRLQTSMNSDREWDEYINTNTFHTGLGCNLDIATTHAKKSHLKKKIAWQGE